MILTGDETIAAEDVPGWGELVAGPAVLFSEVPGVGGITPISIKSKTEGTDCDTVLCSSGTAVKALGEGRIGGYLVRFTDAARPDLVGDFFTAQTELGFGAGATADRVLPVFYHHGQDAVVGKSIIGEAKVKLDDIGLWVDAQLQMRDEYQAAIYRLAEGGKLGWSSGAVAHLVERKSVGKSSWLKTWWIAEASLTPTPAEPGNDAVATVSAASKAAELVEVAPGEAGAPILVPVGDDLNFEKSEDLIVMDTIVAEDNVGRKDVDALKAEIAALTARLDAPVIEGGKMAGVVKKLGGDHDGGDAFKHWVRTGVMNYYTKGNEQDWSGTKAALNETTAGEGGILVPEGLRNSIIAKRDEASIIRAGGALVIQTDLDSVQIPVENARMTTAIVAESGAYVQAEPTFTSNVVPVYKFGNQLRLTDELLADEKANIMGYLAGGLGRAFGLMENQYCIAGSGSSQPKGLITGGTASVTAASTTAITAAEVVSLFHTLPEPYATSPSEVCFITRNATLGALRALASSSVFTFNLQPQGDQTTQTLYGHKVAVSGYMQAATTGLVSLMVTNLAAGYIVVERAGVVMSRNPWLLQATGQVALFTTMRFGGTTTVAEATRLLTQA